MKTVLIVAKREYLEAVRSRTFFVATVVVPLVFGIIVLIAYGAVRHAGRALNVAILTGDTRLAQHLTAELDSTQTANPQAERAIHATLAPPGSTPEILGAAIAARQIDGYLELGDGQEVTLVMSTASGLATNGGLRGAISRARVRQLLESSGATDENIRRAMTPVTIRTMSAMDGKVQSADTSKRAAGANAMAMLLYFVVVFYGMNAASSVAIDKSSRIFEVLLASVEPRVLMAGKLFGMAAAGITQLAIWMSVALYFALSPLAGLALEGGLAAYGITPLLLVFCFIYFLTGFLLYSSIGLAVGAAVNDQSELQRFAILIVMPQAIAMVLLFYVIRNPASNVSAALSLFPPFTHVLMILRMSAGTVPAWQLGLSVVLMVLAIFLLLRVAARIYRVGILMYGKPPTFAELLRWLHAD